MGKYAEALEVGLKRADEEDEKKREEQTDKLIRALSHVSPILDLPPDVVLKFLKGKSADVWKLTQAMQLAQEMEFTEEEMSQVLDLARVSRIMEEDEPAVTGPTGPVGVTGATGPTGPTGASGPRPAIKMHPRFRPIMAGPIKSASSPRR